MNATSVPCRSAAACDSDRTISVVHLVLSLNIGGLEKFVYDLVRCADRRTFSMQVVCLGETGAWGSRFDVLGVPVESLGVQHRQTVHRVLAVARRLRELRPDILHTHNPAPHVVGSLAARIAGVPVVINTKHGRNYPQIRKWVLANRFAAWLSDRVIPVSDDAANVARRVEKVPAEKITVIRNGIDLERFPAVDRPAHVACRRAIHVARICYESKDQRTLLLAVRIVADAEPDFVLDVVGDGPDRADLEGFCDELKLRRHVNFLGFRDDVGELLGQADFFVLSSLTEGLSLTLLEAAASGLPIIATAVGGNPEVVVQGETGLLVPPRSAEALAAAMLSLLGDAPRAVRMGLAGRRRVEEHFDLRRTVERYEHLYRSLISG